MQAGLGYYSDVLMVNEDRTAIHIMQPYQEFEDRRFSSAGRANDSYPFAGSRLQAKILKHQITAADVGKLHVAELEHPFRYGEYSCEFFYHDYISYHDVMCCFSYL